MASASSSRTSPSLLGRLRQEPADQKAWEEFVGRYGPRIFAWCQAWHLQSADSEDLTQTVLLKLADKMRTFEYDPSRSFRAWLKTVTRHALSDLLKGEKTGSRGSGGDQALEILDTLQAREDLVTRLREEFDHELLDEAMFQVRLRVSPTKWEAFRLTATEGLSGAEVAAKLGIKVATVFKFRCEVQQRLQAEIQRLEGPPEDKGNE